MTEYSCFGELYFTRIITPLCESSGDLEILTGALKIFLITNQLCLLYNTVVSSGMRVHDHLPAVCSLKRMSSIYQNNITSSEPLKVWIDVTHVVWGLSQNEWCSDRLITLFRKPRFIKEHNVNRIPNEVTAFQHYEPCSSLVLLGWT